jgi:hypothetical protein
MNEDEIGEIKDELKAYKEQLDALREDFGIFVGCSPQTRGQITAAASRLALRPASRFIWRTGRLEHAQQMAAHQPRT